MNKILKLLIFIDDKLSGKTQISIQRFIEVGANEKNIASVVLLRNAHSFLFFLDGILVGLLAYGFFVSLSPLLLGAIILLRFFCTILGYILNNTAGLVVKHILLKVYNLLSSFNDVLNSYFKSQGFNDTEIGSIKKIQATLYATEYERRNLKEINVFYTPIILLFVFLYLKSWLFSLVLVLILLLLKPIGNHLYTYYYKQKELLYTYANRLLAVDFIKDLDRNHIQFITISNSLNQSPVLLSGLVLLFQPQLASFLAYFVAINYGLSSILAVFSGNLARYNAELEIRIANSMFDFINLKYLLISPKNIKEHASIQITKSESLLNTTLPGVHFIDFSTNLSFTKKQLEPFNAFIKAGGVVLVKSLSGNGKSNLLNAIFHLYNHNGDLLFVDAQNKITNIHKLLIENRVSEYILSLGSDLIIKTDSVSDLFSDLYKKQFLKPDGFTDKEKTRLDFLASVPNTSLQRVCEETGGRFSRKEIAYITSYSEKRDKWVNKWLQFAGGNIANNNIDSYRLFSTLSSGERLRILGLKAYAYAKLQKSLRLIIFDEPFGQLDQDVNLLEQIRLLKLIQKMKNPPAIILISHQYIELTKKELQASIIKL